MLSRKQWALPATPAIRPAMWLVLFLAVGMLGATAVHAETLHGRMLRGRGERLHRRADRIADRLRRSREQLERAEAHHRTRVAERIEARMARLRTRRDAIVHSERAIP